MVGYPEPVICGKSIPVASSAVPPPGRPPVSHRYLILFERVGRLLRMVRALYAPISAGAEGSVAASGLCFCDDLAEPVGEPVEAAYRKVRKPGLRWRYNDLAGRRSLFSMS